MNHFFKIFLFVLIPAITYTSCAQDKKVELINAVDLNKVNKGITLIDVRTPEEYKEGHIKNAVNINIYDDDFITKTVAFDKSKPIYVYCKKGGRSAKAAQKLKEAGFQKIYDLDGGISQWLENDLKVVK